VHGVQTNQQPPGRRPLIGRRHLLLTLCTILVLSALTILCGKPALRSYYLWGGNTLAEPSLMELHPHLQDPILPADVTFVGASTDIYLRVYRFARPIKIEARGRKAGPPGFAIVAGSQAPTESPSVRFVEAGCIYGVSCVPGKGDTHLLIVHVSSPDSHRGRFMRWLMRGA
jgi:hypothetical protein